MKPIRFGLIGCSSIARRRFAPALGKSTSARLERIGSRDAGKAEQFARGLGSPKWGTYEDVMTDPDVDAVYISTPPALHEPWVRVAAEHGKHILCEKPAFLDYRTAMEMVELCRRAKVCLMEAYVFGYHPQHALVRTLLDEGKIGQPRVAQSEFAMPWPADGNYRLQRELGGGVFLDAAGYPAAVAMMLFQAMPVSVVCRIQTDANGVDHAASMILDFPGGQIAHALAIYNVHYRSHYLVLGPEGTIEATRAFAVPPELAPEIIVETKSEKKTLPVAPADQFKLTIEDFCARIAQSQWQIFEERLLRQHAVMEAALRSHLEQRPMLLSEIRAEKS
jgi:dTDP-3,4-didehydro-2,6-dideoxy-alpha-D-glucose 3-reductase